MSSKMSVREQMVLQAIPRLTMQGGLPPTLREIMDETGITSTSVVRYYIGRLMEMGKVRMAPGKPRTLQVVSPGQCPTCGRPF